MPPKETTPLPLASSPGGNGKRASVKITRGRSARHLLAPGQYRESLALASPPSVRNAVIAGMQAALSVLLALATIHLSPWPELVGFPALGALAALFGRYASLQRLRRSVLICGAILTTAVFLPLLFWLACPPPVALVVLLGPLSGAPP